MYFIIHFIVCGSVFTCCVLSKLLLTPELRCSRLLSLDGMYIQSFSEWVAGCVYMLSLASLKHDNTIALEALKQAIRSFKPSSRYLPAIKFDEHSPGRCRQLSWINSVPYE